MKLLLIILPFSLSIFVSSFSQTNHWQQTRGPFAGNINAIVVDSNGRIFVSSKGPNGGNLGVYFSTDNGNLWQHSSSPGDVLCLTVNSSDHVFAGTYGYAIFRSTDHGQTWVSITQGLNWGIIPSIVIAPNGTIYAATAGGGVYLSTDNGDSWTQTGTSEETITSLAVDSLGNIFAGTTRQDPRRPYFTYGLIYRSTNSGASWQLVYSQQFVSINRISVDTSGIIYAATSSGLTKSTDNGTTWTNTTMTSPTGIVEADKHGRIFITTSNSIFHSTNQGNTWIQTSFNNSNITAFATKETNELFVGLDGEKGIHYSSDLGNTWSRIGVPNTYIWALAVNQAGNVFAGAGYGADPIPGGIYRFNGTDWTQTNSGLNYPYITSLAVNNSGIIFAGGAGVYKSTNNGDNWNLTSLTNGYVYSLAINSSNHIFASVGGGVYRSQDDGVSWSLVDSQLTSIIFLVVDDSNNVYSSAFGIGVKRSTDNGDSWIQLGTVGNINVEPILVTPQRTIFVGTWHGGIYRTTNLGETWTLAGLDSLWVWCLARNSLGHIFAGTLDAGVFLSTDNGDTWNQINSGLHEASIRALAIDSLGYVYVGLEGGGVSRSSLSTTSVREIDSRIPISFLLFQNYPNPFNPATVIRYSLPVTSYITLKVYNLLGQELATLVNEEMKPGSYEVTWNASGMPSGVYLYQLQSAAFIQTKKLILLK